jgi:hypothetical protein
LRSATAFNASMTPMRANIVGPPSVATKIKRHSGRAYVRRVAQPWD